MKQKVYVLLTALLWLCGQSLLAQTVTGTVIASDDKSPIIGATVVEKGTTNATLSDADGNFSLKVGNANATLTVSMVGYVAEEIALNGQTKIDVTLRSNTDLSEVTIVGALGDRVDKRKIGYATQTVDGDELAGTQRTNFVEALQGRVAGLNISGTGGDPGASNLIILRNATSFSNNNQPLIIIDGVITNNQTFAQGALVSDGPNRNSDYTNRLGDLDPNEIESVNVLKGPEGAALYGIDASNGAIVITTKKGRGKNTRTINYNSSYSVGEVYRFPEVQSEFGRGLNGQFGANNRGGFGQRYAAGTPLYDNISNFFNSRSLQQHNLSLEGGSERQAFRLSGSYVNDKGVVPNTQLRRINFKAGGLIRFSDNFDVSSTLNFVTSENTKSFKGSGGILTDLLLWPADDDVTNYLNADGTRRKIIDPTLAETDNPLFNANKNINQDRNNRVFGSVQLNYTFNKWLSWHGTFGADFSSTEGNRVSHPESNSGIVGRGTLENYIDNTRLMNGNAFFRIRQSITPDFNVTARLGTSFDDRNTFITSVRGERAYTTDLNSMANYDPTTHRSKTTLIRRRLVGLFGDISLDYKRFLTLNVTGRSDWVSTLLPADNQLFYPSANASFVFSEVLKINGLDYGKLRFGIATSGKDIDPYSNRSALTPVLTTGGGFQLGFTGNSPNLTPERISSYQTGIELGFFKNRLHVDLTYFKQTNNNQILKNVRMSYGTGFILSTLNGGDASMQGVEAIVTIVPIRKKDFEWSTTINFAKVSTQVNSLPVGLNEFYMSDTWLYNTRASIFVGSSLMTIAGSTYTRNNRGDILINPTTGLPIRDANFKIIGDRTPDFTMGLINKLTYKTFSLSFNLDIRKGGDIFNGNEMYLFTNGFSKNTLNRETPVVFNGVLRDGLENSENPTRNNISILPYTRSDYYTNAVDEQFIEKNINWVRLRDLRFEYRLPSSVVKRIKGLQSASVFVGGTELFLLTNYSGADPDVNGLNAGAQGSGAAGFDFGSLARPRTFTVGLNLSL